MKMIDFKSSIEEAPSFYDVKISEDGNVFYYNEKDELHRLDGPAIELANGGKEWFANGLRHRLDGPAYEDVQGNKEWWVNGELHRLDGPAVEFDNIPPFGNYRAWYVNGELIGKSLDGFTDEDFEKWKKEHGL